MEDSLKYWLTGLIDGVGYFGIDRQRGSYCCRFNLRLRDDDRKIMSIIMEEMQLGHLHHRAGYLNWDITSKNDCKTLDEFLEEYPLRTKKVVEYWIWRDAVTYWINRGDMGWERMAEYREELITRRQCQDLPPNIRYLAYLTD